MGIVTALGPALGYGASCRVSRGALAEDRGVAELVLEEVPLSRTGRDALLRVEAATLPSRPECVPPPLG